MSSASATPRIDGVTETKRFTIILENAPDCELQREECTVTAESGFIDDAVEEKVCDVLSGWRIGIGDTVRVVEAI